MLFECNDCDAKRGLACGVDGRDDDNDCVDIGEDAVMQGSGPLSINSFVFSSSLDDKGTCCISVYVKEKHEFT